MHGNYLRYVLAAVLLVLGSTAAADPASVAAVKKSLKAAMPGLEFRVLGPGALPGLYEVLTADGTVLHVTKNARRMIVGDLYELSAGSIRNLSEERRAVMRQEQLASILPGEVIRFAPKKTASRASVWVFTDVDCGYCRRFHQEIEEINRLGITVNYLAFPRAGTDLSNPAMQRMVTAWCAEDPAAALTKLKSGQQVPIKTCANNPVTAHYQLGLKMGVTGTPSMVTESGHMLPGYRPPAELVRALGL